jgi:hypothetical protein
VQRPIVTSEMEYGNQMPLLVKPYHVWNVLASFWPSCMAYDLYLCVIIITGRTSHNHELAWVLLDATSTWSLRPPVWTYDVRAIIPSVEIFGSSTKQAGKSLGSYSAL